MISTKQDGRPSFQFYPKDWLTDIGLKMCSLEAKGLWIDLLCYMFFAPIRGSLTYNKTHNKTHNKPITNDNKVITNLDNKAITKLTGENEEKINALMKELEENQVIEKLQNGMRINRKMYYGAQQSDRISELRAEAGRKGMETRWQHKNNNKKITKITTPSSSSSSSSTSTAKKENVQIPLLPPKGGLTQDEQLFEKARKEYPGTKRGLKTEFDNFKKKHKDWKDAILLLSSSIENQILVKTQLKEQNKFIPEWKHLRTWINQRCWEEETEAPRSELDDIPDAEE